MPATNEGITFGPSFPGPSLSGPALSGPSWDLLSRDAVTADLPKDMVVATGADRARFLHGIVTGNVAGTPVGSGCQSVLLTTKAHVVAEMRIFVRESALYLVTTAGQGAFMADALSRYAIMDDFTATLRTDVAFLSILGPRAGARLTDAGYAAVDLQSRPPWSHADVAGELGMVWLARAHQLGADGFWLAGAPSTMAELATRLGRAGIPHLSPDLAEAGRVASGEPAWGQEITSDYFPMEVGLGTAIDYTKGCFLGQEPIVRIRDRGHVNWRLVRLSVEGEAASSGPGGFVAAGHRLESDAKAKAGKLTSVAWLPDGRGVGLGLAHASVPVGERVRIFTPEGTQVGVATVLE